jgi:hypothetical protein
MVYFSSFFFFAPAGTEQPGRPGSHGYVRSPSPSVRAQETMLQQRPSVFQGTNGTSVITPLDPTAQLRIMSVSYTFLPEKIPVSCIYMFEFVTANRSSIGKIFHLLNFFSFSLFLHLPPHPSGKCPSLHKAVIFFFLFTGHCLLGALQ